MTFDPVEEPFTHWQDRISVGERLQELGYPAPLFKVLSDGRVAWIVRMLYTNAILVSANLDLGYDDRWCFELGMPALEALNAWDVDTSPEPTGWIRHPKTGRRRPSGDASLEYVEM